MIDNNKATNQDITKTLEQMNNGNSNNGSQLVFDPSTGEFVVASQTTNLPADATTINSIAKDGFAKI